MVSMKRWCFGLLLTGAVAGGGLLPLYAQDQPAEKKEEAKKEEPKKEEAKPEEKKADAPAAEKKEDKPAEKPAEAPAGPKFRESIIHLDNPSGVCVHPTTGQVFVSSRQGIFRLAPGKPPKIYLEVSGFPTDIYGKGPMYNIGPLGVSLWGNDRLIVSDGSRKDAEELVRIYKIADAPPAKPNTEDSAEFTLGPIPAGDVSEKGEGNFYASVVWNDAIYITSNGDDTKGWIVKSEIKDGKPGALTGAIETKKLTEVDAPIAITISPDKSQLVVGQGGEVNVPGDALLTFYDKEGKLAKKLKTGLHDITGLAYSPSGKLYATDFAWADTTQGGLFELVIEGEEVKPKKILGLDRPTSLAFDKDGGLYITVFSLGKDTGENPAGGLIRVEPGL
jgi:DNA-binding beta-propeller fold protein YncE